MSDNAAIKVQGLSKSFKLPHNRQSSLKGTLINLVGRGDRTYEIQQVLKNISFEIQRGDFFGIVGRNGSGKSTLLKLLAGIYTPSEGSIAVNGTLTPFIELGVGFNPELTGRENVYLNGALLGFNNKEMAAMYDDIVTFAELERFMDQKLKNYSSGMQVRLAFSIAIRAKSDILVLDEVLAVGDEAFQRKCNEYFEKIRKDKNQTVILVTHSMAAVKQYCNKALMIEEGKVVCYGSPEDVANAYTLANYKDHQAEQRVKHDKNKPYIVVRPISSQVLVDEEYLEFEVEYRTYSDEKVYLSHALIVNDAVAICSDDSKDYMTADPGVHVFRYKYPIKLLNNMELKVNATVASASNDSYLIFTDSSQVAYFRISDSKTRHNHFALNIRGKWKKIK